MAGIVNVWDEASQSYIPMPALMGKDGRGIRSFGYDGEQDKWIVVYTDGKSETIQGPTLEGGAAVSPIVEFTAIDGGNRMTVTDAEGPKDIDILNGTNGQDGKTPVKGTDYFTEAEKQDIAEQAAGLVAPEAFWVTITLEDNSYSTNKTYEEIVAAKAAGKLCVADFNGAYLLLSFINTDAAEAIFSGVVTAALAGLVTVKADGTISTSSGRLASKFETWTFTLEDGSTVTKGVALQ